MHLPGIKIRILIVTVFVMSIYPTTAWAYLDPGTGSMLFQMVVASFLGLAAMVATFWTSVKAKFKKLFRREQPVEVNEESE